MSTTIAIQNMGLRPFAHPQFGTMPADPAVTKTKVLKQVNADNYSVNYPSLAKFGVLLSQDGTAVAGSQVHTGTGNVGTDDNLHIVDMTTSLTLTLPTLASVPAGHHLTFYLRTAAAGTLTIDGNGAETVIGNANQTGTAVGYTLHIRKGASATDWEAATV